MFYYLATILGGSLFALLAGGLAYRKQRQSRTARMLVIDTPDRIVEELFVRVGGIDQWLLIRGEDHHNPVLLVLHGGPGWPNATFTHPLRPWEKYFTIAQWDHCGTGKTLARSGRPRQVEMTFARRVADAIELSEFLCQYLHQEKLILLAESMGTLTGLPLVKRRPDLFSAIVVTDLCVNVLQNEALKYRLTQERLHLAGNARGLLALERIGGDPALWDLTGLAEVYFQEITAPHKEMALIQHAGHFAAFSQPEQFLNELLSRVYPLIRAEEALNDIPVAVID